MKYGSCGVCVRSSMLFKDLRIFSNQYNTIQYFIMFIYSILFHVHLFTVESSSPTMSSTSLLSCNAANRKGICPPLSLALTSAVLLRRSITSGCCTIQGCLYRRTSAAALGINVCFVDKKQLKNVTLSLNFMCTFIQNPLHAFG